MSLIKVDTPFSVLEFYARIVLFGDFKSIRCNALSRASRLCIPPAYGALELQSEMYSSVLKSVQHGSRFKKHHRSGFGGLLSDYTHCIHYKPRRQSTRPAFWRLKLRRYFRSFWLVPAGRSGKFTLEYLLGEQYVMTL